MRRHDLVVVEATAWGAAIAGLDLPAATARCVADWAARGRPAMVRRRLAGDPPDAVPLAVQLPNAAGRLRLALSVPPAAVTPRARVGLAEAARSAPVEWAATIAAVRALGFGEPTVYGGLLWQHLTGEPVLRPTSDLDLLWHPAPGRVPALIAALARIAGTPRLDGEIVLADGAGVAWRELHAAAEGRTASVAAKTLDGIALRDAAALLREPAPC